MHTTEVERLLSNPVRVTAAKTSVYLGAATVGLGVLTLVLFGMGKKRGALAAGAGAVGTFFISKYQADKALR